MTVEGEPGAEPAGRAFVIARVFGAPREAAWKAWTEAERLERWWGPKWFIRHLTRYDGALSWTGDVPCVARRFACAR